VVGSVISEHPVLWYLYNITETFTNSY